MNPHPLIHSELARQRQLDLQRDGQPHRFSHRSKATQDATPRELVALVREATAGDDQAWESLVARFTPALRAVARGYRLSAADVDDVVQAAWTSALTHIGSLREPEAISGWMMVIARREALRIVQRRHRELLVDEPSYPDPSNESSPEATLLASERREAVSAAVEQLPSRQRELVRALFGDTEPSYDELALKLSIPKGSIGPTRQRALVQLRRNRNLTSLASSGRGHAAT